MNIKMEIHLLLHKLFGTQKGFNIQFIVFSAVIFYIILEMLMFLISSQCCAAYVSFLPTIVLLVISCNVNF